MLEQLSVQYRTLQITIFTTGLKFNEIMGEWYGEHWLSMETYAPEHAPFPQNPSWAELKVIQIQHKTLLQEP